MGGHAEKRLYAWGMEVIAILGLMLISGWAILAVGLGIGRVWLGPRKPPARGPGQY